MTKYFFHAPCKRAPWDDWPPLRPAWAASSRGVIVRDLIGIELQTDELALAHAERLEAALGHRSPPSGTIEITDEAGATVPRTAAPSPWSA